MKNMKLEWKRGDWAAYFGLMTNNLTNLLTMMGLLIFVVGIPKEIVYGRIAPAFGLAVLVASICYAWFGMQMARATGRTDVTALPSGPSAPSIFTVTFLVLMPVYQQTGDAEIAIQIGLVWCFVEAMILAGGSFLGETIRKMIPRTVLLSCLSLSIWRTLPCPPGCSGCRHCTPCPGAHIPAVNQSPPARFPPCAFPP